MSIRSLVVYLQVLWSEIHFLFDLWLVRFDSAWVLKRIGTRIESLERDPRTTARLNFFELDRNYELVARFYEARQNYEASRRVTLTHGRHPVLPSDMREDVYVRAGLRAVRQSRHEHAREFLALAQSTQVPAGRRPTFPLLEGALVVAETERALSGSTPHTSQRDDRK